MKKLLTLLIAAATCLNATAVSAFVDENEMQADLLQMLANFTTYMKNDFQECVAPNNVGETCGCFMGENTMANDERGVRPNADLGMICAFLVKYGRNQVTLPDGITWDDLEQMAMKSLVFAYSTHKANKLKVCKGNNYWGSVSDADHVWESSLWAMSVAYSAFFQWDRLTDAQKGYIYQLLKAECNYELERSIPTGYAGDTKAEENGWEADVLAVTLGLFPNDPLAPQWFQRLREFAINSYSQKDDAQDKTVIDPDYDATTVCQLYKGQNLYDDFTLQNHNYFHTSYQNVVIQELGEAALALKLFQQELHGQERWKTNALMHNNDRVMQEVLYWLALSDGELAMPNGNDWSLFLYDQITSYSTNACFLRDPHALLLENRAYQMIKARQQTTKDGSWLLRADVGARRMGVEAHRVMMTWLMHHIMSTATMKPTTWEAFCREYSAAKVFPSQNIVRASTDSRFTCFSWSEGLKSYTGYIAPHASDISPFTLHPSPITSNMIVPFRAHNTGNFIGWYEVEGRNTNAKPAVSGIYQLDDNAFIMNGELQTNDEALNNRFALYSTPGNAVVYLDEVRANIPCTITKEKGGLMAISVDEFTNTNRTLYTAEGQMTLDGTNLTTMNGPWINVDNCFGIVNLDSKQMAFGEKANNNSVMTALLFASYNDQPRNLKQNETADQRILVYYSNTDAASTDGLTAANMRLHVPAGWNGAIITDTDSTRYMILCNFSGQQQCNLSNVNTPLGKPVFAGTTTIEKDGSTATFTIEENHSTAYALKFFIEGSDVETYLADSDPSTICLRNAIKGSNKVTVNAIDGGRRLSKKVRLKDTLVKISIIQGRLRIE